MNTSFHNRPTGQVFLQEDLLIQDYLNRKDFFNAEKLIFEKLNKDSDSADGHYFHGVLYYLKGKLRESVESLNRALKSDPHHTDAAICLSVLLNDVGKYDDAKNVFEQANQSVAHKNLNRNAVAIDRKFAVKHLELADLYFRYKRYDESIEEYSKAISLDPTTLEIRIRRAKAYAKKGFLTRAIQELQQLKNENQEYLPARIQLGLLHYSQGNVLDAELEWEGTLTIEPQNREAIAYLQMAKRARMPRV